MHMIYIIILILCQLYVCVCICVCAYNSPSPYLHSHSDFFCRLRTSNSSTAEVEARRSGVKGQPWLYTELEDCMDCMRPHSKTKQNPNQIKLELGG